LLAFLILFLKEIILFIIWKFYPQLYMSLNFQIWTFAYFLWIIAIILASTIWYQQNIEIVYTKFNYVINSITLPSSEILKAIYWEKNNLNADLIWTNNIK
jgi:hypothetical protein